MSDLPFLAQQLQRLKIIVERVGLIDEIYSHVTVLAISTGGRRVRVTVVIEGYAGVDPFLHLFGWVLLTVTAFRRVGHV